VSSSCSSAGDFSERDLMSVLRVAQDAAKQAGDIMRAKAGNVDVMKFKANSRDIVTEVDLLCQMSIQSNLSEAFPNDRFLGEEAVGSGSSASMGALADALEVRGWQDDQLLFVVDPIDGTTNFQSGIPLFCVSIGAVHISSGQVVLGVIYNPMLDEMTYAVRGQGAFTNGKLLGSAPGANKIKHLNEAVINVGFPAAKESTLNVSSRAIYALATKVRGLRMFASASQVMAWVAQGKLNGYVSWDLNSWDVCAGVVIVEEAHGFISDMEGKKATLYSRDIIVSSIGSRNPDKSFVMPGEVGFHGEILDTLIKNNCVSYGP